MNSSPKKDMFLTSALRPSLRKLGRSLGIANVIEMTAAPKYDPELQSEAKLNTLISAIARVCLKDVFSKE